MKYFVRQISVAALVLITKSLFPQCTVVINEIMASPIGLAATNSLYDNYINSTSTGPTQNAEWIELYNPDPCNSIDISCWILGGNNGQVAVTGGGSILNWANFTFPKGTIIPPLGFVSVGGTMSGATFTLDKYWQTNNFCIIDRWFLRDTRGYLMLSDANGNIMDAVYWGSSAADLTTYPATFGNTNTSSCACNLPQGPGTNTYNFPAAVNIPGIEYVGNNHLANGSPTTSQNPYGYTMKRQEDGSPVWVINGNNSLNACNAACYSLTVNNFSSSIQCNQTGTATGSHTITGYSHAPYTYSWSNGSTGTTANGLSAGAYTYTVTDVCGCTKTATAQITQAAGFTTTAQGVDATCTVPGSATANNTGGSSSTFTYSWNTNPTQTTQTASGLTAGTYTVEVSDANGCTATASVTITALSNPFSINSVAPPGFCTGQSTTISATPSGGSPPFTYSWSDAGQTSSSIQVTPLTNTTYTITITDVCGQTATTTVPVVINPIPVPDFSTIIPQNCKLVCVNFSDSSTVAGSIITWEWDFGDKSKSDEQHPQHCYSATDNYVVSLTVTSDKNCRATYSTTVPVVIDATPIANFETDASSFTLTDNVSTNFTNLSTGGVTYFWNFGDSIINPTTNISTEQHPSHTYSDTGSYCITLITANALGCKDTSIKCIEIQPTWTFYIPNTFTPDGNGVNDFFEPVYTNISNLTLWIYDRWGNEIYQGTNAKTAWDGKVANGSSGTTAQIDTYVWVVNFKDNTNKQHSKKGHVNLLK